MLLTRHIHICSGCAGSLFHTLMSALKHKKRSQHKDFVKIIGKCSIKKTLHMEKVHAIALRFFAHVQHKMPPMSTLFPFSYAYFFKRLLVAIFFPPALELFGKHVSFLAQKGAFLLALFKRTFHTLMSHYGTNLLVGCVPIVFVTCFPTFYLFVECIVNWCVSNGGVPPIETTPLVEDASALIESEAENFTVNKPSVTKKRLLVIFVAGVVVAFGLFRSTLS